MRTITVTVKLRLFRACMLLTQAENLFREAQNLEQAEHRRRRRAAEVFRLTYVDEQIIEKLRREQCEQLPKR